MSASYAHFAETLIRLQAAGGIEESGVDHLVIARAGLSPEAFVRLENKDLASRLRQGAREREADHPGADNDAVHVIHECRPASRYLEGRR